MEANSKLKVTLLTGRTIEQGVGKEQGKASEDYFKSVAVCYVDPADLKKLGIRGGTNVRVSTDKGAVILKAVKSLRGPHVGVIFIPYGVWANAVVSTETDSMGMPSLKGTPAEIESAPDKAVLSLSELLREEFGKR